ncbi:U32 family peptidase [Rhizobium puerariae]|uniref:Ubiquinone biosynthesis protein UbiV n=1 Tax=Rhizobium puerariae TaxID=1585791 RepID=A0ABV6AED3_9HYPH
MSRNASVALTMGPVYYLWDGPKWRDFHFRIADESPFDRVVIGETVCSKRQHFIEPHIAEVIERLEAAGKTVVLSTLALVTLERESRQMRELIAGSDHPVEANDLSALGLLGGKPHSVGPLVNVYNAPTARLLASRGAETICLPPELPFSSVERIVADGPDVNFEVFAFGRMPLAISARCAHARSKGKIKDNCQFVCGEEPDGLPVNTLDRQSFLVLNGVQTVSHTCQALPGELAELAGCGIAAIRLSPQDCDMVAVAELYRAVLDGRLDAADAIQGLGDIYPAAPLSNGFHHAREGAAWVARARDTALGARLD